MTENTKEQIIVFDLPEDVIISDVINEILTNNSLEESDDEYFDKLDKGKETRLAITRDATLTLFEKKVSEEKLAEIMAEHLETSKENAVKVIGDIKKKILPYTKKITIPEEISEEEIAFKLPDNSVARNVVGKILKSYGLEESKQGLEDKYQQGVETNFDIIVVATLGLFGGRTPEEKLAELLASYLGVSNSTAQKILGDVKQNLLPLIEVSQGDEDMPYQLEPSTQELLLEKIRQNAPKPKLKTDLPIATIKNVETKNVEENAKKMEGNVTERKGNIIAGRESLVTPTESPSVAEQEVSKVKTVLPQEEKKGPDDYRESLE